MRKSKRQRDTETVVVDVPSLRLHVVGYPKTDHAHFMGRELLSIRQIVELRRVVACNLAHICGRQSLELLIDIL